MVPPNLPTPLPAPQISPEHLQQLQLARYGMRKVRRAAGTASFDGWTVGGFGALTFLLGLPDPVSIILGLGMVAIAFVEIRGASRLRRLDITAPRALALNQLVLGLLLFAYAAWRISRVLHNAGDYDEFVGSDPQMKQMLEPVEGLTRMVMMTVYFALIAIAILGQGSMAIYYATRRKHIEAYLAQTPPWIIDMQRAGVAV